MLFKKELFKLYEIRKKCWGQNCLFQEDIQTHYRRTDHFLIRHVVFVLIVKNVFVMIKNLIFPTKYTKYENKKQNCLFQKDLQIFLKCKCSSNRYKVKSRARNASFMKRMYFLSR